MNYFAHALPFLDRDPYFIAGTAVPDWMSAVDRKVRVRQRLAEPVIKATQSTRTRLVAQGAVQHLVDDAWFHVTRGFVEVTSQLARMFREAVGPDSPTQCGFLGHIVTEMLLDAVLIERYSRELDRYYEILGEVDFQQTEDAVNEIARGSTDRLTQFIPLFLRERFLYDYAEDKRLLGRLNGVLNRVKLSRLPETIASVLTAGRVLIRNRVNDLLPPEQYVWP